MYWKFYLSLGGGGFWEGMDLRGNGFGRGWIWEGRVFEDGFLREGGLGEGFEGIRFGLFVGMGMGTFY